MLLARKVVNREEKNHAEILASPMARDALGWLIALDARLNKTARFVFTQSFIE